jgi:acetyl esterase/lipase
MTSRHLVDPQLLPMLELFPPVDTNESTLPTFRAFVADTVAAAGLPNNDGLSRQELMVPGPGGAPDVRVLLYRPANADSQLAAVLHIHGGGMVIGVPEVNDERNAALARELQCVVVSVDYRLAPETTAPGNVEDCYAVLAWLHGKAEELGVDAGRIAVLGESAGGGLAAALALLARDRAEYPVALQVLLYPMLDDRTGPATAAKGPYGEFVWTGASNVFGWSALIGNASGGDGVSPYAAPARAKDVAGLPPAFIGVGALDLFLEENVKYAQRLAEAGVPVEFHIYPGAVHAFDLMASAAVSKALVRDYRDALSRLTRGAANQ